MDDNMSYDDTINDEQQHEIITRSRRVDPPSHYAFKIDSYSVFSEIEMKKCESGDFEVDGYKWKLILYPNGDEEVQDHISLYLAISAKDNLPLGWEVRVIFRFFIFDQIRDNYLTIQDGKMRRYSKMKSEHGFTQLLSHNIFNKASNGFLVDNSCTFGVEISVLKASNKGEILTIYKEPQQDTFFWSIYSFSVKINEFYISEPFNVKGRQWRMVIYPNGHSRGKTSHISLYLRLDSSETIPLGKKIYAKFLLGVYNFVAKKYIDKSKEVWFAATSTGNGFHEFLSRKDMSPHLQNDVLYLKARIVAMSAVEEF
ncbi:MATH domain and coiled-coil domain-containing protein At3g58400-like [Benincasa hispida]|uniref:MATH domain and coiled-coil domain-containing protein At3g58400-like n=1 Tax=Benincasa hispida TaxID=102211 RepID=UPI0019028D90|nr:MATH domain and coiled-coil domain-containing protein At3g58400-like [Benincasa hispida]